MQETPPLPEQDNIEGWKSFYFKIPVKESVFGALFPEWLRKIIKRSKKKPPKIFLPEPSFLAVILNCDIKQKENTYTISRKPGEPTNEDCIRDFLAFLMKNGVPVKFDYN